MRKFERLSSDLLAVALAFAIAQAGVQAAVPTTDQQFEHFLATAEIVSMKKIGTGITNPDKLTLREGDVELHAVYKNYDNFAPGDSISELGVSDRYTYDVAAYRLDRMIGLNMIPVAIVRRIHGKPGVVQQWIEDAFDEGDRIDESRTPPDPEAFDLQANRMHVFDVLIFNTDRNRGNILYEESDWTLHLIDHTRAFRLNGGRPKSLSKAELRPVPELVEGLSSLNKKTLNESLGKLLHRSQIGAILKRRNQLLDEWGIAR